MLNFLVKQGCIQEPGLPMAESFVAQQTKPTCRAPLHYEGALKRQSLSRETKCKDLQTVLYGPGSSTQAEREAAWRAKLRSCPLMKR